MRVAHFDCFSGISGDMTLGALIDLGVDPNAIRARLDSLGLPITLEIEKVRRNGLAGTQVHVLAPDHESHRYLADIEAIIARGDLTARQRELAMRIFRRLGEAEAAAHGISIEKVHFHEVGALDSIADIVGSAVGLDLLGVEKFTSRSVPPGSGSVKCAHGIMPVPTPATAFLLRGVPLASAPVKGELVTPTGAAILTTVVSEYIDQPTMTIEQVGCGAGTKDFWEQPNLLRMFIGHAESIGAAADSDEVWVLETNLDDVPAEVIGYCFDRLFEAGALDVYSQALQMKKNRPGVLLGVIAHRESVDALEAILFRETGTFGVRRYPARRSILRREVVQVSTPWGMIRAKRGWREGSEALVTPEYEDCARVACEQGLPLREVYRVVLKMVSG